MERPSTRVLVVDDEAQFRSLVTELLIDKGFDARAAPDARAALDLVADRSFGVAAGRVLPFGRTSGDGLFVTTGAGAGADALRGARLRPDESIAALVALENQAVVVSRPREHPRYSPRVDEMPPERPGLVCAPLRDGSVFGTVSVAGPEEGEFSTEDRDLLAILARQAAGGIDNAPNPAPSIHS